MSAYGNLFGTPSPAVTPNLDSLATEGVLFTAGHSSNAVCTPSRYALLTGKYNWREFDGITGNWGGTMGGQELPRQAAPWFDGSRGRRASWRARQDSNRRPLVQEAGALRL